jgi:hypothetical protein
MIMIESIKESADYKSYWRKILLVIVSLLFWLSISGCAVGLDTKTARVSAWGFYAVHPTYGIVGIGYINYYRTTVDREQAVLPEESAKPPSLIH